MNNMNFDENTMNKLKDMMNKGELNDVISQIPPEMIQNFSSMMSQNNSNTSSNNNSSNTSNNNNFDFSQIDMNTILKMKSVMEKLNQSNDPRSNLLYSLKPYLREEKKGKLDQYANLMNIAKIADIFKDNNKESKSMLERMKELIADQLSVNADIITEASSFKDDLGADSLDLFELVMALEDEYSIEIPADDLQKMATVGDVIGYLKDKGVEE